MNGWPGYGVLNAEPGRLWPDAALHHGARMLVVLVLAAGIAALFPTEPGVTVGRWQAGTVAEGDVLAEIGFDVRRNAADVARERREAEAATVPTFVFWPTAEDSMLAAVATLFSRLDTAAASGGTAGVTAVLEDAGVDAGEEEVQLAASAEARQRLHDQAALAVRSRFPGGVMAPAAASRVSTDTIRVVRDGMPSLVARSAVLSGAEFYERAPAGLAPGPEAELLRNVLARFLHPSLVLDAARTARDRRLAADAVSVVATRVLEGEAIVRASQQVGEDELRKLDAYRAALRAQGRSVDASNVGGLFGSLLLNALLLSGFGVLVLLYRRDVYRAFRSVLTVAAIFAFYFLAAFLGARLELPAASAPVAFVAIALAVLWDGRLAFAAACVLAALTALQEPFSTVPAFVAMLAGGCAAALSVRAFRRLSQIWVFIAVTAAAYALALSGLQLRGADFSFLASLGAALVSTVLGAIVAIGFVPVLEWLTGITTAQTLVGWADLDRPLLRRLAVEAPGTYAHTMQVAVLAEAGAGAVGANVLLCRAGAYYHDVGKLVEPGHFIENQRGDNPHDDMDPVASAAVVRDHVTEGVKLARREKLPKALEAFVAEHHGDHTIGFFLEKAREQAAEAGTDPPDPELFQYGGPRPRSRETGIAMLADAVESAARALKNPTKERIAAVVEEIVSRRAASGQLDDTSLTFRDLAVLKARFAEVLAGMHHQRIGYPETRDLTEEAADGPPPAPNDHPSDGPPPAAKGPPDEPPPAPKDHPSAEPPSATNGPSDEPPPAPKAQPPDGDGR